MLPCFHPGLCSGFRAPVALTSRRFRLPARSASDFGGIHREGSHAGSIFMPSAPFKAGSLPPAIFVNQQPTTVGDYAAKRLFGKSMVVSATLLARI